MWTHQLRRAADAVRDGVLQQLPQLAEIVVPEGLDTPGLRAWIGEQTARHGSTLALCPAAGYGENDPLLELIEIAAANRDRRAAGA